MTDVKLALAAENVQAEAVGAGLRTHLETAAPIYRQHFWPAHDASNRRWIADVAGKLRGIEGDVVRSHERLYGRPWFSSPIRVDIVWIGRGYSTLNPYTHATVSPAEIATLSPWTGVEFVLHEAAHELILPTEQLLAEAFGEALKGDAGIWHPLQFYLTGSSLQGILRARGIDYTQFLYSTGLLDRAWSQYRRIFEQHWAPFVRAEITRDAAIARTVEALRAARPAR